MSWLNAEIALNKRLNSIVGIPTILEYENIKSEISHADNFLAVKNFPAISQAMDKNYSDQNNGFFQVSIFDLTNKGKRNILSLTDLILSNFRFGTEISENDDTVFIEESYPSPARVQSKYYVVDITINYNFYTSRI